MIKGNERRVVIIRGDKDAIYDMACVFIKSEKIADESSDDIVKTAETIISKADIAIGDEKEKKEPLLGKRSIFFFVGMLSGCALSYVTYMFICALFS